MQCSAERLEQQVVDGGEVDGAGRHVEVVRDDGGVLGVLRVAVAGHDDAQGVVREGALGQRRDDGRVDAAREAEDGAGAAGGGDLGGDPAR